MTVSVRSYLGVGFQGPIDPYWHFSRSPAERYDYNALRIVPITVSGITVEKLGTKSVVNFEIDYSGDYFQAPTINQIPKIFKYIGPMDPRSKAAQMEAANWVPLAMEFDPDAGQNVENGKALYGLNVTKLPAGRYDLRVKKRSGSSDWVEALNATFSITRAPLHTYVGWDGPSIPLITKRGPIRFRLRDEAIRLAVEWLIKDGLRKLVKLRAGGKLKPVKEISKLGLPDVPGVVYDLLEPDAKAGPVVRKNIKSKVRDAAIDQAWKGIGEGVLWLRRQEDYAWLKLVGDDLRSVDKGYFREDVELRQGGVDGLPEKLEKYMLHGYEQIDKSGFLMHAWALQSHAYIEIKTQGTFEYRYAQNIDVVAATVGDLEDNKFTPIMTRWAVAEPGLYQGLIDASTADSQALAMRAIFGEEFNLWMAPYHYEFLPRMNRELRVDDKNDTFRSWYGTGLSFPELAELPTQPNPLGIHVDAFTPADDSSISGDAEKIKP